MDIIHIVLLIGVWLVAIAEGISFINLRDQYIKSNEAEKPQELKKAQNLCLLFTISTI